MICGAIGTIKKHEIIDSLPMSNKNCSFSFYSLSSCSSTNHTEFSEIVKFHKNP